MSSIPNEHITDVVSPPTGLKDYASFDGTFEEYEAYRAAHGKPIPLCYSAQAWKKKTSTAHAQKTGRAKFTDKERQAYRKEQARIKKVHKADFMNHMIDGDQTKFVADLKKRWANFHPNQFMHYFVDKPYDKYFNMAVNHCGYTITPYSCECLTEEGRPHCHYIVDTKNDNPHKKRLGDKLAKTVRAIMAQKGEKKATGLARVIYGRVIVNAPHLINTILYIQTEDTEGRHGGDKVDCKHRGQFTRDCVLANTEVKHWFRNNVLKEAMPEYAEEHKRAWDQCKMKRHYRTVPNVDDLSVVADRE